MSVLSEKIIRLRDRANELSMLAPGLAAPYVVPETKETMALSMLSAASEMSDAADTIESLRERLQDYTLGRGECELVRCENCEHAECFDDDAGVWCRELMEWRTRDFACNCGKAVER